MSEKLILALVTGLGLIGVVTARALARWVLARDAGTEKMQQVSNAIKSGAEAFLRRQFRTIILIALLFAVLLFTVYGFIRSSRPGMDPVDSRLQFAAWITLSFLFGAACSLVAGYLGMWISIRSNIRTAAGIAAGGWQEGFRIALRGGAVSGLLVVAMSLLGIAGLYGVVRVMVPGIEPTRIPMLVIGYGFGGSFVALFAQLGGGIYTKSADVGADLVGKIEQGIPEDDQRNPAVIADLVGDNVGDCAGRGADLFESTAAESMGAMILGATTAVAVAGVARAQGQPVGPHWIIGVMMFPLVVQSFGIIASIVAVISVRARRGQKPMAALHRGYYVAAALSTIGLAAACRWLLYCDCAPRAWLCFFAAGLAGVIAALMILYITSYYTETDYRPARSICMASRAGAAPNIIMGLSMGFECVALPALTLSFAILAAYLLGRCSGFVDLHGEPVGGFFGTAVATVGMLSTTAYVLAMDTFGPIVDNAGGIVEMSGQPQEVRGNADLLDAAGNTTKALTKGYAIASAALAAFLLFGAYERTVRSYGGDIDVIDISKPPVFLGGFLGAMLVFLFSGLAIRAVGRGARCVIEEVRAQFREKPGILQGTEMPDYGRCVDIVTKRALREMILPGLLGVCAPICVGLAFRIVGNQLGATNTGVTAVGALLLVATMTGILLANFMNNVGGAWDNAKKFVELGNLGGKKSPAHQATIVGDTVGDPLKDTAGPSLHVLIKLISTVSLVLAPLFI